MDEVRLWNTDRTQNIVFDLHVPLAIYNPDSTGYYAGLLDAWRMNGNLLDEGGFLPNNGIPRNLSYRDLRQKQVNYVDYNSSLVLDGTPDCYCAGAPNASINATTGITIEAWIRRTSFFPRPAFGTIVAKGNSSSWNYGLFASDEGPTGRIYFAINAGDTITSPPLLQYNWWTHVAATYRMETHEAVLYINGDSVAARAFPSSGLIPNDPDSLFVGGFRLGENSYSFKGQLDQVRVWRDVVRTADQIRANMYKSIDFATIPSPGSGLTVYNFDGRNITDMSQFQTTPALNFKGTARMSSSHLQIDAESTSPVLRDDPDAFGSPTFPISRRQVVVPDNTPGGVTDSMYLSAPGTVSGLRVAVLFSHTWIGDIGITLTGPSGIIVNLLNRRGTSAWSQNDLMTIFTDNADSVAGNMDAGGPVAPFSPFLKPDEPLSTLTGSNRQGWWKLKVMDLAGGDIGVLHGWGVQILPTAGVGDPVGVPDNFSLEQNFPNPFNPTTSIRFSIPVASEVTLDVYNILGQRVETLVQQRMIAGSHTVSFDASRLASGTYFYRITAGRFVETRKMMLVR